MYCSDHGIQLSLQATMQVDEHHSPLLSWLFEGSLTGVHGGDMIS
jgi:hypothetical protein